MNEWERFKKYCKADPLDKMCMRKGNEDFRITLCPELQPLSDIKERKMREVQALDRRLTSQLFMKTASDENVRTHNLKRYGYHQHDPVYTRVVQARSAFESWASERAKGSYGRGRHPVEDLFDAAEERLVQRKMGETEYGTLLNSSPDEIFRSYKERADSEQARKDAAWEAVSAELIN